MSPKNTPPGDPDLADQELIDFAKAAFKASPLAALSALRHMAADGAESLKDLGVSASLLERLFLRAAIAEGDDWEEAAELSRSIIRNGDEQLNLAAARAVALAVEGSASSRSKWASAPRVELDFMDARSLIKRSFSIAQAWVECPPLALTHEDAIQTLEMQPDRFEGRYGVERIKDALGQCDQTREKGAVWLRSGPNVFAGALERSREDEADERLIDACRELSEKRDEGAGPDQPLALERLSATASALGQSGLLRRDPDEAMAFLGDMTLGNAFEAIESFVRASDWASEAPSFSKLGPMGLRTPDHSCVLYIRPHALIKNSEVNEAPLGLCELALFWEEPRLSEIGRALGESGNQAQRIAEAIERYESAQELAYDDPEAAEALAQSAALLWESHKGAEAIAGRPSLRV